MQEAYRDDFVFAIECSAYFLVFAWLHGREAGMMLSIFGLFSFECSVLVICAWRRGREVGIMFAFFAFESFVSSMLFACRCGREAGIMFAFFFVQVLRLLGDFCVARVIPRPTPEGCMSFPHEE